MASAARDGGSRTMAPRGQDCTAWVSVTVIPDIYSRCRGREALCLRSRSLPLAPYLLSEAPTAPLLPTLPSVPALGCGVCSPTASPHRPSAPRMEGTRDAPSGIAQHDHLPPIQPLPPAWRVPTRRCTRVPCGQTKSVGRVGSSASLNCSPFPRKLPPSPPYTRYPKRLLESHGTTGSRSLRA